MDIVLLKKIARNVLGSMKIPEHMDGYSDDMVKIAVNDMIEKHVITTYKATRSQPKDGNYQISLGKQLPPSTGGKSMDIMHLDEHEFEKQYGEKLF